MGCGHHRPRYTSTANKPEHGGEYRGSFGLGRLHKHTGTTILCKCSCGNLFSHPVSPLLIRNIRNQRACIVMLAFLSSTLKLQTTKASINTWEHNLKEIILRNVNHSVNTKHQDLLYTITSQQEAFLLPNCMQTANYSFTCASHWRGEETVVLGRDGQVTSTAV